MRHSPPRQQTNPLGLATVVEGCVKLSSIHSTFSSNSSLALHTYAKLSPLPDQPFMAIAMPAHGAGVASGSRAPCLCAHWSGASSGPHPSAYKFVTTMVSLQTVTWKWPPRFLLSSSWRATHHCTTVPSTLAATTRQLSVGSRLCAREHPRPTPTGSSVCSQVAFTTCTLAPSTLNTMLGRPSRWLISHLALLNRNTASAFSPILHSLKSSPHVTPFPLSLAHGKSLARRQPQPL